MKSSTKSKRISTKILFPVLGLILAMALALVGISENFFKRNSRETTSNTIKGKVSETQKNIERVSKKALYGATVIAEMDVVKEAYAHFYETDDLESSVEILKTQMEAIEGSMQESFPGSAKIHFHLPPARSFYRVWSGKRGDDLSDFRNTVLDISKTHEPIAGIESGRSGLVARGLA
ncbi:MAG: hypothetical protein R2751_00805 [Bacteroidales bacterium]